MYVQPGYVILCSNNSSLVSRMRSIDGCGWMVDCILLHFKATLVYSHYSELNVLMTDNVGLHGSTQTTHLLHCSMIKASAEHCLLEKASLTFVSYLHHVMFLTV